MPVPDSLTHLGEVPLLVEVEVCRTWATLAEVLALTPGAVVPLEAQAGPLTVRVGGALAGWGESAGPGKVRVTAIAGGEGI